MFIFEKSWNGGGFCKNIYGDVITWIIHILSIKMSNSLLNSDVLNKIDLKIAHYSLHQFSLRLPEFIGI
jgi:hypothetical protein